MDFPVAYMSRVLVRPEFNYSTTVKECLAILYVVKQFRTNIYGTKLTLMSDHQTLMRIDSVKDPGPRLISWRLKLRDYEYEFRYKPGKLNTNADALSRNLIIENLDDEVREANQPVSLLPIITRQANKRGENTSKPTSETSESESKQNCDSKKKCRRESTRRLNRILPRTPGRINPHDRKTGNRTHKNDESTTQRQRR